MFGNESRKTAEFLREYWKTGFGGVDGQFLDLYDHDLRCLSLSECLDLRSKTFLNESLPFGRIDIDSIVGEVCIFESEIEKFDREIRIALSLVRKSSALDEISNSAIKFFVPLAGTNLRENGSGKSCHWLKGAIFLSLPLKSQYSTFELALNIAHELGHQVLMVYQDCDAIMADISKPVYSAIRKTYRPAILSFHALLAIYFMLIFCQSVLRSTEIVDPHFRTYIKNRAEKLSSDLIVGSYSLKDVEFSQFGFLVLREILDFCDQYRNAG